MDKTIVCVSAFGFADTVVINGRAYTQESALPSVIIEDHHSMRQQLYIYDSDATYERTGMGLYEQDKEQFQTRTPVAMLWQQLKYINDDYDRKQKVANSLAKYITQLICELWPQDGSADGDESEGSTVVGRVINKAFLQSHCQLVLCIPDNFDEAEQQALLNAFSGFEIQLLWRSIAALLGYFNGELKNPGRKKYSFQDLIQSSDGQTPSLEDDPKVTAHVLYIGPDSFDLSSYDLKLHCDEKYVIPVRLKPVYSKCACGSSFLHYALSYADRFIKENDLLDGASSAQEQKLQHDALISQIIYQFPEAWGKDEIALSAALNAEQSPEALEETRQKVAESLKSIAAIARDSAPLPMPEPKAKAAATAAAPAQNQAPTAPVISAYRAPAPAPQDAAPAPKPNPAAPAPAPQAAAPKPAAAAPAAPAAERGLSRLLSKFGFKGKNKPHFEEEEEEYVETESTVLEELPVRALHIPVASPEQELGTWVQVQELLDDDEIARTEITSSPRTIKDFYNLFDFDDNELVHTQKYALDFVSQLKALMKNNEMQLDNPIRSSRHECLLVISPMTHHHTAMRQYCKEQGCSMHDASFELIAQALEQMHLRFVKMLGSWRYMAHGGYVFQSRLNYNDPENVPTYMDRLHKLSMVVSNVDRTEYLEKVLIENKEVPPQQTLRNSTELYIPQGSDHLELYVSNDERFNKETINNATTVSFKAQGGISVQKGMIYFASGRRAQHDELVRVVIEQKALSGFVKLRFIPLTENSVLPPQGETQTFDPSKKIDFEGTLPHLAFIYPPQVKPNFELSNRSLLVSQLRRHHVIFRSASMAKNPVLYYYNGSFASPIIKDVIHKRLLSDYNSYMGVINSIIRARFNAELLINTLKECLPFNNPSIFGDGRLEQFNLSVCIALRTALSLKKRQLDLSQRNNLIKLYCDFVPDKSEEMRFCCTLLQSFAPYKSNVLRALIELIENHPNCFNPSCKDFCLEHDFALVALYQSSKNILLELQGKISAGTLYAQIISRLMVAGTNMMSAALKGLMYSLLYRKIDRDFLSEREIEILDHLLDEILHFYEFTASQINRADFNPHRFENRQRFVERFNLFVTRKLQVLLPEVKNYLHKQGSNPNIMTDLQSLDEEGDED